MTAPPRYVVDASVGAKWLLTEPDSALALELAAQALRGAATLLAPDVFVAEVTNVIWKRARLIDGLTDDEARQALNRMSRMLPDLIPSAELVGQALDLALDYRHPVYDCLYAALAMRDDSMLVTADRRLVRTLGPATGRVVHLEDLDLGA